MRKFRKITIGGIESKIFNLILITVILLSVAFLAVSLYRSSMLANLTAETSARQQETTSAIISGTMDQVMDSTMKSSSEMEAIIVDEMFRDVQTRVTLVADYAAKVFSDPDSFPAKAYAGPDPSLGGQIVAQVLWADGVDPQDPAIAERTGLLANLSERHRDYNSTTFAVKYEGQWFGLTYAFITHSKYERKPFDQRMTPYTDEGRRIYQAYRKRDKPPPRERPARTAPCTASASRSRTTRRTWTYRSATRLRCAWGAGF